MKNEKRERKMEEIRVLDKGKNFDGPIIMISICCIGILIPFRF